jgi:hypothetical protein
MRADTDTLLDASGKDGHVKKVSWTFFAATTILVLAQGLNPATAGKYFPAIIFPGNSRQQGIGLLGKQKGNPLRKTGS